MTHIVRCSRKTDGATCQHLADRYRCGEWVCPVHAPKGDTSCSHSLHSAGACSYCGASV